MTTRAQFESSAVGATMLMLLGGLWMSVLIACGQSGNQVRKLTYPPNFSYLEGRQIKTNMGGLAVRVVRLGALLEPSAPENPNLQEEVGLILMEMEKIAAELDPQMNKSNHPLLEKNITAFREDLAAARADVTKTPPNYFLAGTVAGACRYCHR